MSSKHIIISCLKSILFIIILLLSVFIAVQGRSQTNLWGVIQQNTVESSNPSLTKLDLSYLHRTTPTSLANAIQETLKQQVIKNAPEVSSADNEKDVLIDNNATSGTTKGLYLDIDLTSSLIQKDIQEILSSLQVNNTSISLQQRPLTIWLQFAARRNQWTHKEITKILQFILENNQNSKEISSENRNYSTTLKEKVPQKETVTPPASNASDTTNVTKDTRDDNLTAIITPTVPDAVEGSPRLDDDKITKSVADTGTDIQDENNHTEPVSQVISTTPTAPRVFVRFHSLDLGWNDLSGQQHYHSNMDTDSTSIKSTTRRPKSNNKNNNGIKAMQKVLQQLIASKECPSILKLDVCGLNPSICRVIAKGIIHRNKQENPETQQDESKLQTDNETEEKCETSKRIVATTDNENVIPPLSLHLARNGDIGDPGIAALAAAIRTVASQRRSQTTARTDDHLSSNQSEFTIFNTLNLSGCSIGDVGAEAIAIALERNPFCIKHLDLSNNNISDEGAIAIARALMTNDNKGVCGKIETLDLSNNSGIGDRGAKELAQAFEEGCIQNIILRSCHLHADGAACFGKALKAIVVQNCLNVTFDMPTRHLLIDLSGNPLGLLRKKPKSKGKYSAGALTSKATATTAAYFNLIGKTVQKGLKDFGLAENGYGDTLESDDEEEEKMGKNDDDDEESKAKCGALSFAEAFVDDDSRGTEELTKVEQSDRKSLYVRLGLRHCSFDTRAAEALAAVLQESRQRYPSLQLKLDLFMNDVLEDDTIAALSGAAGYDDQILEMAENYLDAMEAIREAEELARKAAKAARARAKAEAELQSAWGTPAAMRTSYDGRWDEEEEEEVEEEEEWDSDADYDVPGEDDDVYW